MAGYLVEDLFKSYYQRQSAKYPTHEKGTSAK